MRWVFISLFAILALAGCGQKLSVEQQIIATLRDMEADAEAGNHLDFMANIADAFKGQQGSLDRREFHRFMIYQINQHRRLQAQFFPIYVTATGEGMASAHFKILVTGGAGLLPESGQLFEVESRWVRDGGDWLLSGAEWEAVRLPDLPAERG